MHDATEEYLALILDMEESGTLPTRARMADRMGITIVSVSQMVRRLVAEEYALVEDHRRVALTGRGRTLASNLVRRRRLAECLLADVIGLEWEKLHLEAGRWEHVISADVEACLTRLLGDPPLCPHGHPVPGCRTSTAQPPDLPLVVVTTGLVRVTRIARTPEYDIADLRFLADHDLLPGKVATVLGPTRTGVAAECGGGTTDVPTAIAERTFVTDQH